jgi:hypothetical protein
LFALVGDSTITSGRPPDAAEPRVAGTLVPPAVVSVVALPSCVVLVGTVLLSVVPVVLGAARRSGRWCGGRTRGPALGPPWKPLGGPR